MITSSRSVGFRPKFSLPFKGFDFFFLTLGLATDAIALLFFSAVVRVGKEAFNGSYRTVPSLPSLLSTLTIEDAAAAAAVAPEDDDTVTSCGERGFGGTSGKMYL